MYTTKLAFLRQTFLSRTRAPSQQKLYPQGQRGPQELSVRSKMLEACARLKWQEKACDTSTFLNTLSIFGARGQSLSGRCLLAPGLADYFAK